MIFETIARTVAALRKAGLEPAEIVAGAAVDRGLRTSGELAPGPIDKITNLMGVPYRLDIGKSDDAFEVNFRWPAA